MKTKLIILTELKLIKIKLTETEINKGRCTNCQASRYCGRSHKFECTCKMNEHYIIESSHESIH